MRKSTKSAVVAGTVLALTGGGVAFAYWTTSGAGTGSATAGTNTAVVVSQLGTISGLVPGGDVQAVDFNINNPATTNQYVTKVVVSISSITNQHASSGAACTADDFTVVQPTDIATDLTPGDHPYQPSGATIAMNDSTSNQDACKGATVNLAFAAQ